MVSSNWTVNQKTHKNKIHNRVKQDSKGYRMLIWSLVLCSMFKNSFVWNFLICCLSLLRMLGNSEARHCFCRLAFCSGSCCGSLVACTRSRIKILSSLPLHFSSIVTEASQSQEKIAYDKNIFKNTNLRAGPISIKKAQVYKLYALERGRASLFLPAASMKALLRRAVRRGSLRLRRKSLRRPHMAWISSTLLSRGTAFPRRNLSLSSFIVRSQPEIRQRPVC